MIYWVGCFCVTGLAASVLFVTPLLAVNRSFMGDSLHATAMGMATTGCGVGTLLFGPINEALLCRFLKIVKGFLGCAFIKYLICCQRFGYLISYNIYAIILCKIF